MMRSGRVAVRLNGVTVDRNDKRRKRRPLRVEPLESRMMLDAAASAGGWTDTQLLDIDGDGRAEIVGRQSASGAWLALGQRDGQASIQQIGNWNPSATYRFVQSADLDGDGAEEVVAQDETGSWWALHRDATGFSNVFLAGWSADADWANVALGDWNGDGRTDIVARSRVTGDWWNIRYDGAGYQNDRLGNWDTAHVYADVHLLDLDGDQAAEIVGRDESGGWWLLTHDSAGALQLWPAEATWDDVSVADFDGDGLPEIIGRSHNSGDWWSFESTAAGYVSRQIGHWNPDSRYTTPQVIDIDGDGATDFIARDDSGAWWALKHDGESFHNEFLGGWSSALTWDYLASADVDGDGRPELVGHFVETGAWWRIRYDQGFVNERFATMPPGTSFQQVQVVDLDGDGRDQFFGQTNWGDWSELLFDDQGAVCFRAVVNRDRESALSVRDVAYTSATPWNDMLTLDVDGDGAKEIVGRVSDSGEWWVLWNRGQAQFTQRIGTWQIGDVYSAILAADLYGDGTQQVVALDALGDWRALRFVAGRFETVYLANWDPTAAWADAVVADLDGDGCQEIVARDLVAGQWWIAGRRGSGFVSYPIGDVNPSLTYADVLVADVTGDGVDDIVGRDSAGNWSALTRQKDGLASVDLGGWGAAQSWLDVCVADLNGDGVAEILGRNAVSGDWWALAGAGTVFQAQQIGNWNPQSVYSSIHIVDIDGDGKQDVVGRDDTGSWWALKLEGGQFGNRFLGGWSTAVNWGFLGSADIEGDGRAEIVGYMADSGAWWVIRYTGQGYANELLAVMQPVTPLVQLRELDLTGDKRAEFLGQTRDGDWWELAWNGQDYRTSYLGSVNGPREAELRDQVLAQNPDLINLLAADRLSAARRLADWAANAVVFDLGGMQGWVQQAGSDQSPADWYYNVFAPDAGGGWCGVYAVFAANTLKLFGFGDAFFIDFGQQQDSLTHMVTVVSIHEQQQWRHYLLDPTANIAFVNEADGRPLTFEELIDRLRAEQLSTVGIDQLRADARRYLSATPLSDPRLLLETQDIDRYVYRWLNYGFADLLPINSAELMLPHTFDTGLRGYLQLAEERVFSVGPGSVPNSTARESFLAALAARGIPVGPS